MFVKVCGVKSLEELEIVEKYADATGVVVNSKSKRNVPLDAAREIISSAKIPVFLVSTMKNREDWEVAIERTEARYIQIHSDVEPSLLPYLKDEYGVEIMKAFRVPQESENPERDAQMLLKKIRKYEADLILLDTGAGSGKMHDLRVTRIVAEEIPVVVAGGLKPENVEMVIKLVKPFGVDVSSGVERNGKKDEELVREFVRRAKNVVR
ncbi:phosphoribosylanthranilate isomerase [Pyrococcus abyssi]|uniref:N-(5'-phosphoribosyl)anthranilate isomerase n=1 Tax=Pyrococcus abyssi (strain GE5 / Orsay) TaxID=272844 RepID=TRPF_PYRAB|nr:phosphoribosylanthranilate isomerase [Pyrococcus abyssi]Q9V1G7.1 RecName: Full=N-(5'-phosphoribosyl)anthranilate isomerase; Short=PRAI [Pyrococcus abyssi GE5]CAB49382.1 trpF phosphoribosyl anthranilate isomerase (EC 5.3.1.24) [Pyrococcus abyssi GE5]CCE69843.1 TPA: N-(5'-phosphoribosyl)anthranilate isomerase [Pyrococcus abyssi GE5]